ncbi:hypothetical protein B6D17_09805 [Gilliamella apis]|uniref:hypothetical protein n=1 Tax=Gilliamella apis TaxID=1970738 RepID=UPI000A339870|nr:hypothetical protein [Gilliamella apis]OTQ69680.1 hypothetical protein B6D17_09805 [Gilliamella apis]
MVLVLTVIVLQSISFSNYALTTKTTNIIYGSAPYLTFDGGRTRVTNTEALLGISLSDGRTFTPTTNNSSSTNPIELPVVGQSFNDIGMLVPRDTNSIGLSSLIGTPYNYWGDDDGDGQGVNGITATGSLNLSIVDKNGRTVARNEVLTSCNNNKAPYKLTLSNSEGRLTTRYGVPNESRFSAGNATYYIKPKAAPAICFARPDLQLGSGNYVGPADIWDSRKGFLTQSVTPSSYGLNFPTTGANNLYFYLDIGGSNQALSWAPVSHGGITATMTDSTSTRVRVTLTGPFAPSSQWSLVNPGRIAIASLPQVFELVGRDSSGNAVVKYGFELKQWFVNRGYDSYTYSSMESWCNKIGGYRVPKVSDLTNASCQGSGSGPHCQGAVGATPSAFNNYLRRRIGAGFFTEWGGMANYSNSAFDGTYFDYWTSEQRSDNYYFLVGSHNGRIHFQNNQQVARGLCVYP